MPFGTAARALPGQGRDHAVRRSLTLASPGALSITEATYGADLHRPGRFAREYRQRFGERPIDTLRRPTRL